MTDPTSRVGPEGDSPAHGDDAGETEGADNDIEYGDDSPSGAIAKLRAGGRRLRDGTTDEVWIPDNIEEFDRTLYEWIGQTGHGWLDRALPRLSHAANYSRLWLGISGVLYVAGGERAKATAIRAVAAVGITSVIANLVVKQLPRARPTQSKIPENRRVNLPTSSSFPSGHSASAAAFATVIAHGEPGLLPPVAALAAAVAFSRVYTGVHYPTDVMAGTAIGLSVGSMICAVKPIR